MLDHVLYQFGSGNAFFVGSALILAAVALSVGSERRWLRYGRDLAGVAGILLVALSAIPLPWWAYAGLGGVTLTWLNLEMRSAAWAKPRLAAGRAVVALAWVLAVSFEAPYHVMPTLPAQTTSTLFIIGDSVSAGVSEGERAWPQVFAQDHPVRVCNFSRPGATAASAGQQAERLGDEPGLVLLEIGGNDLLGATSATQFKADLDRLLRQVCRPERTVVMLELPLPPFTNRFGLIQRRLARSHGVVLVPRRFFIRLLTTPGATSDGIHLTRQGHALMAREVWRLLEASYSLSKQ